MVAALLLYRSSKRGLRTTHQCSPSPLSSPLPHTCSTSYGFQHSNITTILTPAFPPEPLPPPPATAQHPTSPLAFVPPNTPNIPDTWTPSETHLDTNTIHGQTLFRTIQPTQWSRKYNLAGQPVLDISLAAQSLWPTGPEHPHPFTGPLHRHCRHSIHRRGGIHLPTSHGHSCPQLGHRQHCRIFTPASPSARPQQNNRCQTIHATFDFTHYRFSPWTHTSSRRRHSASKTPATDRPLAPTRN